MSQRTKRHRKALKQKINEAKTHRQCPSECDCNECSVDLIQYCKDYIECNLYSASPYRLRNFHFMIDLILFIFGAIYVVFVPYTKQEESFNMQATHDMMINGYINVEEYQDYEDRITFIAAILICLMVLPMKLMATLILPLFVPYYHIDLQKQCQYLIRFALLIINITALSKFRQSFVLSYFVQETDIYHSHKNNIHQKTAHIKIAMIQRFSLLFAALILAQFHFLFYSSRLLPNCMALPSITIAFAHYFRKNWNQTLMWFIGSCILFRFDTIIILIPYILIITYKQRLNAILFCIIAILFCVLCTITIDSWFWTGFNSITWPEFEALSSKYDGINYGSYELLLPLIPKMLLINTFFVVFSLFKIYPMLFVHELRNGKNDISLFRLMSLFIDWESVSLLFICILFVFLSCSFQINCTETESRFTLLIVCPPLTLLSCIGCIRLFTLWGFRGFDNANYTLFWFKHNLYQRQKQLYFLWIPHNLLFASMVKKLVSFETPVTWISCRRYAKILQEIPYEILDKVWYRKQTGFFALTVSISIIVSICFAWYQVHEASYDYPGGVAITMFPRIIANYKTNMAPYGYYEYPFMEQDINDTSKRRVHSKRGHRMNRDYTVVSNASMEPHYVLYDGIDCVHIGNLAAISGVTRFLIPSLYEQFRFSAEDQIQMEEYAFMKDPCNLYQEMYAKLCQTKWNDYGYDEQYFEKHDDYLDCYSSIDYRYPTIQGFDYLISEHSSVPGYYLIPHGVIYSKPINSNVMNYALSFFKNRNNQFLKPSLYVLKREKNSQSDQR